MKPKYYIWVFVVVHFLCSSPGFSEERSKSDKAGENSALNRFTEQQREKLGKGEVVFEYVIEETDGVTGGYGKARVVYLSNDAARCLCDYLSVRPPSRARSVFLAEKGPGAVSPFLSEVSRSGWSTMRERRA
jgi:hypothetical protein